MNRILLTVFVSLIVLDCAGCTGQSMDELVPVRELSYNRVEKNTVIVQKGDITPAFDKPLELAGYEEIRYRENSDEYSALETAYNITLKAVNCEVGQYVKKGDVLVSFASAELDRQIKDKQEEKRLASLELEHIKKLERIDSNTDYSAQIEGIRQQIKICELYIQDINDEYAKINIICEENGVVRYVNPSLFDGYVMPDSDLVIVSHDKGYYEAEVDDTVTFDKSGTYVAGNCDARYELKVMDEADNDSADKTMIDDNSYNADVSEDAGDLSYEQQNKKKVYFTPIDNNNTILEKTIQLQTKLKAVKNVCYVDRQAIISKDDNEYVYVVDDKGRRRAVEVKTGDVVDNYCIILDGLKGGETVSLP